MQSPELFDGQRALVGVGDGIGVEVMDAITTDLEIVVR